MKYAVAPLVLLVGLSAAACGSDDSSSDASADASTSASSSAAAGSASDFCDALSGTTALEDGADVKKLHDALEAAGVPDDAGDDVTTGLQVYLGVLEGIDENATAEDLQNMKDPGLSKKEQAQVQALVTYAATECAPAASDSPSDSASSDSSSSDAPSESPSESSSN